MDFYANIDILLRRRRLTASSIAARCGMEAHNLRRVIRGEVRLLAEHGEAIARAVGVPAADLVYLEHAAFRARHCPALRAVEVA